VNCTRHLSPRWTLFILRFQREFEVISLRGRTGKENRLFFCVEDSFEIQ